MLEHVPHCKKRAREIQVSEGGDDGNKKNDCYVMFGGNKRVVGRRGW